MILLFSLLFKSCSLHCTCFTILDMYRFYRCITHWWIVNIACSCHCTVIPTALTLLILLPEISHKIKTHPVHRSMIIFLTKPICIQQNLYYYSNNSKCIMIISTKESAANSSTIPNNRCKPKLFGKQHTYLFITIQGFLCCFLSSLHFFCSEFSLNSQQDHQEQMSMWLVS